MAALNVFRYRRRTVITASAIAVGVMFTIAMDGFIAGSESETVRNVRDFETGEGKIYPEGYFADREFLPFDRFIERDQAKRIERDYEGYRIAPRAVFAAELYFAEDSFAVAGSLTATVYAVDASRDGEVFRSANSISSGRWLAPEDEGIVVGSWLAEDIGATVGTVVTVECRGRGGFYQTFDARVVGIATTDDPIVNRDAVFMELALADDLLALDGAVTEYALRADSPAKLAAARERAPDEESAERGYEFRDWRAIADSTLRLLKGQERESAVFLFFIFVIAAVGVTNTMLMAVMERKNEIGMLRALGFQKISIRALFLAEGFCIGLIGAVAGILLGCCANAFMVRHGFDLSGMLRDTDIGYRSTGVIRSAWNVAGIARIGIGALAISTFVAWFPSGKTLKREVADILRK